MPDPAPTQNAPQKPKSKGSPVVGFLVLVVIVAAIVNAGNDDDPEPSTDTAPVVTEAPAGVAEPEAALPEDGADAGLADTAVVPDVVGLNHQLAQDTLQASGFYLLDEQDATGQGRLLLYDRNWVVVSQSVPAGTSASTDTMITLSSKKIGE
jgi:PASTA domain-containing protein